VDKRQAALRFVIVLGVANFFADLTYEGARGIIGPFLGSLGASATVVGFVAGFGELVGYGLRSVSGYFADRTGKYWLVTLVGYSINMLAVPALALAGAWPLAAGLIVAERTGRAIRKPATDAMLSEAGKSIGAGWAFGLNEALDQAGAMVGPLIVALVLALRKSYQSAFAVLLVSALLCLGMVVIARLVHSRGAKDDSRLTHLLEAPGSSKAFWLYVAAGALIAAGFADFSLIGFHFRKAHVVTENFIPIYYAAAMGAGAVGSLVFGRLLDRLGQSIIIVLFFVTTLFAPLVFFGNFIFALLGMVLWGLSIGAQDSLLKALLTPIIPPGKRSSVFGLFDAVYGLAWFAGSAVMGLFYDMSILGLVLFSITLQLAALPLFAIARKQKINCAGAGRSFR
jgi:predicted MFS family arabinose efflux permease